jgi:hypothetical protein
MDRTTLLEKVKLLERQVRVLDGKYKLLRRRAHVHRGALSGEQADELRLLLRGHRIDAAEALSLHPEDFFDRDGELDGGAVLWWLKSAGAKS